MSKVVSIGKVLIGGGNIIAVQSMTNIAVTDTEGSIQQIKRLASAGCDIVRVAVDSMDSAKALGVVKQQIAIPIVADIHFDYKLAITAIENGADKIRINPGNIGLHNVPKVVQCAKTHNIPIRIGVNSGSLDKQLLSQCHGDKVKASVQSVLQYVHMIEQLGYDNLVLSIKSSNVLHTIASNRQLAELPYPIHLGVTEAGILQMGIVKGAIGIGSLLADNIGDTIRVSLTADPVQEVLTANNILRALGRSQSVQFVSCPKCGRCDYDIESVANTVYNHIKDWNIDIKVAVMGCEVNGPGECADADIGMAGGKGKVAIFTKGKVIATVDSAIAVQTFIEQLEKIYDNKTSNNS